MKKIISYSGIIIIIAAIAFTGYKIHAKKIQREKSVSVGSATLISRLTVSENLVMPTTSTSMVINGLDEVISYAGGSASWDVDRVWADTVHHSGTIDLTVLENALGEAMNLTGDNIVAAKFYLANVAGTTCTISNGASNSYPLFGTTYSFQLKANQSLLFKAGSTLSAISATVKNITYTGSSDAAILYVIFLTAHS
jgi:hypothetical protein